MFSKSQFKLINSLGQKKYRARHGLFVVEGKKTILELLASSFELHALFTTQDIFEADPDKIFIIDDEALKKISKLTTPQVALAVFHIPEPVRPQLKGLVVALDNVQDPGNLGTIIRMCDWFGVEELVCSTGTVDCYNPKVIQATMGSITRVRVHYCPLPELVESAGKDYPIFGAFLGGKNVYTASLPERGILVMGNEANGISGEVEKLVTQKLVIPRFGEVQKTESLNVATATAILLSEFRRPRFTGR